VDTSPIRQFSVYLTHAPSLETLLYPAPGATFFDGHEDWQPPAYVRVPGPLIAEYDARNIDPSIAALVGTHTEPQVDAVHAIQVGETAAGFSFVSPIYDPSPKHYCYDTIASGEPLTNGTGKVAAVGLTPEPTSLLLLALGGLALVRPRRSLSGGARAACELAAARYLRVPSGTISDARERARWSAVTAPPHRLVALGEVSEWLKKQPWKRGVDHGRNVPEMRRRNGRRSDTGTSQVAAWLQI
jgi:hypothetical protein